MSWLFLAAALAFVLGGVLAVRPSKAQQRVAKIRENAIASGVHVKLPVSLRFPEGIEKGRRPYYCRRLRQKEFVTAFYCTFRDGERIRTSKGDLSASLKTQIDELLLSSDPLIDGFYLGDGLLGFSWQESDDEEKLSHLKQMLDRAEALLDAAP